jgi:hypothetical protein
MEKQSTWMDIWNWSVGPFGKYMKHIEVPKQEEAEYRQKQADHGYFCIREDEQGSLFAKPLYLQGLPTFLGPAKLVKFV